MSKILTDTGLNLPDNITEEEFFEAGKFLASVEHGLQWATGDWYNAIPWGDKEAACLKAGLSYNHAVKCGAVSKQFPILGRTPTLSFKAHKLLTNQSLTDEQRSSLLKKACDDHMSSRVLKLEINTALGKEEPVSLVEFREKGKHTVEVISSSMPKNTTAKLKRSVETEVRKLVKDVEHNFYKVLEKEVSLKLAKDRDRMRQITMEAKKSEKNYRRLIKGVHRIITEDEFKLIRSCLHPDKHNGEEKYQKAFEAFNRLADKFTTK